MKNLIETAAEKEGMKARKTPSKTLTSKSEIPRAKVIISSTHTEIQVENGDVHLSPQGADPDEFFTQTSEKYYEGDLVSFQEVTEEKLKKMGTEGLVKKFENSTGTERSLVKMILIQRGVMKRSPRVGKAKKATLATPEGIAEAKLNVGKQIKFYRRKHDAPSFGKIIAVVHDKRVSLTYYRIQEETGGIRHKRTDSNQIEIL